jgi:hypothetical protein
MENVHKKISFWRKQQFLCLLSLVCCNVTHIHRSGSKKETNTDHSTKYTNTHSTEVKLHAGNQAGEDIFKSL